MNLIGTAAGQCAVRKAAAAKILMEKVAVESATAMMMAVLVLMQRLIHCDNIDVSRVGN